MVFVLDHFSRTEYIRYSVFGQILLFGPTLVGSLLAMMSSPTPYSGSGPLPTAIRNVLSHSVSPRSSITTSTATPSVTTATTSVTTATPSVAPVLVELHDDPTEYFDVAEYGGKIIYQSVMDGKPRVTNITDGRSHLKAKVGVWDHLDDQALADHEARHSILADLRRRDPDRVCPLCSYLLRHTCSLTELGAMQHCKECCKLARNRNR